MKALFCSLLLVLILFSSRSQVNVETDDKTHQVSEVQSQKFPDSLKTHKAYLGVGFGYPWMFSADITYLSRRNIGFSINYSTYGLKSVNIPSDFESAFSKPTDSYSSFNILLVFDIRLPNQKFRPGFEAGLSLVSYKEAYYKKYQPTALIVFATKNYEVYYSEERFLGFQARMKLEALFTHFLGCEFALAGNINKYRSFVGIEAIFLIGRVRERDIPVY